jgi:hypothetical protein
LFVAGAVEVLQRVRPLPSHLVGLSKNSLDSRIIEVFGRQLSGLEYGIELAAFDHCPTMID